MKNKFNNTTRAAALLALVSFTGAAGCFNEATEDGVSTDVQRKWAIISVFSAVLSAGSAMAASVSHTCSRREDEELEDTNDNSLS